MRQKFASFENVSEEIQAIKTNLQILRDQRELVLFNPFYFSKRGRELNQSFKKTYSEIDRRKREFDYKSIIISLYGALENFVDRCVEEYIQEISVIIPRFSQMPEAIRNNHLGRCIRLGSRLLQSPDLVNLRLPLLIQGAHEVDALDKSDRIVVEAFSSHTANVRTGVIDDMLVAIGVEKASSRISSGPPFKDIAGSSTDHASLYINSESKFFLLDDLCVQRNSVAHGRPQNILSFEALEPYVDFAAAFCAGLNLILTQEFRRWAEILSAA